MDEYEDYDDIGYPEWIENEMEDAWMGGVAESWSPALLAEVTATTTPTLTALFRRDRETLWINAFPELRLIVETYPPVPLPDYDRAEKIGLVKERYVGKHADIADEFDARCSTAIAGEWERQPCIYIHAEDPWDVPSVLDKDQEMPF